MLAFFSFQFLVTSAQKRISFDSRIFDFAFIFWGGKVWPTPFDLIVIKVYLCGAIQVYRQVSSDSYLLCLVCECFLSMTQFLISCTVVFPAGGNP